MNRIISRCNVIPLLALVPFAGAQTPVGTAFTYQGQLKENGVPVNTTNGTFEFKLFDADTGGSQIGSTVSLMQVNVSNGLFSVSLDFGADAFGSDARWLETRVYKSGTGWITLAPRQRVTPAPYAMTAANLTLPFAATVPDNVGDAFAIDYAGSGYAIRATSAGPDAIAIYGSGSAYDTPAILGQAAGPMATAVQGYASATDPGAANAGGSFFANGGQGAGVYGAAQAVSGKNYGVYGRTNSQQGYGGYFDGRGYFSGNVGVGVEAPTERLDVAGILKTTGFQLATASTPGYVLTCDAAGVGTWQPASGFTLPYDGTVVTDGVAFGLHSSGVEGGTTLLAEHSGNECVAIRGSVGGTDGIAVFASATGQYGYAVNAYASGIDGAAVYATGAGGALAAGQFRATGTATTAVDATAFGNTGRAVNGFASATSGVTYGVYGRTASSQGRGVYGEASASSGTPIAIEAYAAAPNAYGMYALNEGGSGNSAGVRGDTASVDGIGVWGVAGMDEATGFSNGVRGETYGAGAGVYGKAAHASATTYGVMGEATSTNGYGGYFLGRGYFSGNVGVGVTNPSQKLDVAGTIKASGVQLTTGPTAGYVLTCDAAGNGIWQPGAGESLWQENGTDIYYAGGDVGIGTSSPSYPLHVVSSASQVLVAEASAASGTAIRGIASGSGASGVKGVNSALTGSGNGVYGSSQSASGCGLYGENTAGGWAGYFNGKGYFSGIVGIGTSTPQAPLDVNGIIRTTGFRMTNSPADGYVLTCDANGVGTWQEPTGGLTLPYNGTCDSGSAGIMVTNNGAGAGLYGVGGNYGVRGESDFVGTYGWSGSGDGVRGSSNAGVGVWAQTQGTGTAHPALYAKNTNSNGISIFSTCGSTDANAVFVNTDTGDIIKGFSGPTGGNLVFRVQNDGTTSVSVLNITGGADLSEQFDVNVAEDDGHGPAGHEKPEPGQVVCIDPEHPGALVVSTRAYDHTVAGVISGAGGVQPGMMMGQRATLADGAHPVALTGRVYVWVDASHGAIEPGDLLTTSDVAGHAMKATNYERSRGATLGKAMTRLAAGRGLVLMLVQPQ
jgi:hypothetical protein